MGNLHSSQGQTPPWLEHYQMLRLHLLLAVLFNSTGLASFRTTFLSTFLTLFDLQLKYFTKNMSIFLVLCNCVFEQRTQPSVNSLLGSHSTFNSHDKGSKFT